MKTFVRIACMLLCCAALLEPAAAAAATLKKITIPATELSPLMTQQTDGRFGPLVSATTGEVLHWAILDLPVGATIKGMSYRRLGMNAAATVVGLDRVQPGKSPAWQRIIEGSSTEISPPNTIGTIVVGTPTGVPRKVARKWKYFVLVKTEPSVFVGDIKIKYILR